jgi:hypothetical protein
MTFSELQSLLTEHPGRVFRLILPNGGSVPVSFHVTEIGKVCKTFLDCGGTMRKRETCQLQVWVGEDFDHRIETALLAGILKKGSVLFSDESIPVEIEYEDEVLTQYTIASHVLTKDAVVMQLAHKHTECLEPERCGLPSLRLPGIGGKTSCCGQGQC